jgi:hypothetical protein
MKLSSSYFKRGRNSRNIAFEEAKDNRYLPK